MAFEMNDYVEVAQRLADLFEKYPDASLRGSWQIIDVAGVTHVAYTAECWRSEGDSAPGIGCAWEQIPGKTPYTRGSELQNAETSAWGRAIVAVGASQSKRIASADEMRSAQGGAQGNSSPAPERSTEGASSPTAGKNKVQRIQARIGALGPQQNQAWERAGEWKLPNPGACNPEQIETWDELLKTLEPA